MCTRISNNGMRCVAFALFALTIGVPPAHAQAPNDSLRLERLVDLGRLWGTIKFFHPYLAYRAVDWDSALVATIPTVKAATDSASYARAIQTLLDALDDQATRIVEASPPPTPVGELDSLSRWTADSILVVTMNRKTMRDFSQVMQELRGLQGDLAKARRILFDLRWDVDAAAGALDLLFYFGGLDGALARAPVTAPGQRMRVHMGYAPQQGVTSGGYYSGFIVQDGKHVVPSGSGPDASLVFLVNDHGGVPSVALALQQAGSAAIVSEGRITDASLVETRTVEMSDGVQVQVRLGELVYPNGTGGVAPDLALSEAEAGDGALGRSLALLRNFDTEPAPHRSVPAVAAPAPDQSYADVAYPSLEYRILAAFRIWAVIDHFFPYRDLMDDDWDEVLRTFLPRMEQAEDATAYHLAVAEMYAHIRDTHGFVDSEVLSEYFGTASSPLYLRWIEDAPVVAGFYDEEAARASGIEIGDIILEVDGEDAVERAQRYAKYIAASTPQALMSRAVGMILSGSLEQAASLKVEGRDGRTRTVEVPRRPDYRQGFSYRTDSVLRMLDGNIGYADLDRLTTAQVAEMFERFKDTKAIIFDMRGYPNGTTWTIASYLADEPGKGAALADRPMLLVPAHGGGGFPVGESWRQTFTVTQRIPAPGPQVTHYTGKTVMLIDERAISQAEHSGLFFEAANETVFIGSHTNGADGDVTNFFVPGGIALHFTGQSVRHVDGRQLQRVGLVPDVEVKPTIEGIRAGRDEVLEAALAYLMGVSDSQQ